MGQIKLVRIDFRLIHGQVITKWFAQALADRIVIVDDHLAQDDFMKEIYEWRRLRVRRSRCLRLGRRSKDSRMISLETAEF